MNNPNVAFVCQVNGLNIQFYYNSVDNTYGAIFGDRYHNGLGPILKKNAKGNWCDVNGTLNKELESVLDSKIKRYEEAKKS